jgi:lipopolysaccharide transport system ATP-binding protein
MASVNFTREIAISLDRVSKYYAMYDKPSHRFLEMLWPGRCLHRDFHAIEDVSIDIGRGETVGVIGRNGSGKSTLLQLICGVLSPTRGSVTVSGRVAALLELGSGFNPEFTGRDNVYMNAQILGLTRAQIDERLDSILSFADIDDFIDQPVKTYSSGMFVRLAFAVIAHVDADILVIDEALAVGDAFFSAKCMRFLRRFQEHGTVVFVSHDTGAVLNLCSRAIWLHHGRVVSEGQAKLVCESYLAAFLESYQGAETEEAIRRAVQGTTEAQDVGAGRMPDIVDDDGPNAQLARYGEPLTTSVVDDIVPNPESRSFGAGGAEIQSVALLGPRGDATSLLKGGDEVTLAISVRSRRNLVSPIVGFYVKDRLGQNIFGENTYKAYMINPVIVDAGTDIEAQFAFRLPILANGEYTVSVAVAEGTQENHVHHHWVHDALAFKVHSSSVSTGLVGIPMRDVRLDVRG